MLCSVIKFVYSSLCRIYIYLLSYAQENKNFILLLAQQFDHYITTITISQKERIQFDDNACTRSTNVIIFTRSPEPRIRNGFPCVPLPWPCCLLAADPDPCIQAFVRPFRNEHVLEKAARVDGVDKAVVVWLVSDNGQSGPYLFALQLRLVIGETSVRPACNCNVPRRPREHLEYLSILTHWRIWLQNDTAVKR